MKPKNTICLWYDKDAHEAARFYEATFPDSRVLAVREAPADYPGGRKGDVLTVEFTVLGIPCLGLNGGPQFRHSEAFSFQIATDTLRRIIDSYRTHHPDVRNLQEDWDNPRFVELLTFGWNAGYSEKAGVGKVVQFMEAARMHKDVTIDTVHEWARGTFGASPHLLRADKVGWSKSVAALYAKERARDEAERTKVPVA